MKTSKLLTVSILGLAVGLTAACGSEAPDAPAKLPPISGHVATVEAIRGAKPVEIYGVVQPSRQSFVSSRVIGPVVATKVEAGEIVKKGQALLEIQPQTVEGQVAQAKGALAQAEAALSLAEKNARRFEQLHEEHAASDLELDMARMQHEQALGAVKQAKGAVQAASSVAAEAVVRAPFAARIVSRLVDVGDLAAPGRPLVRVESLSGRKVWLTVREADIQRVHQGQKLSVSFDTRPDLGTVDGIVNEIVPAADPATHTFTVKVSVDGLDVASGTSARADLPGKVTERLAVPASAVFDRGGLQLVVALASDGTARTRAVTTGASMADGRVEVLSGLKAGDRIVVDAPGPVADGTPVEVVK
ncbi:MAG: efflux RND transporter periplasmic adaptor subunit [Acidobacteria bacterium]|nr:efflux RND transporter periplasmic adaptor subunit [Acidobacteriota bacterium]